MPIPKCVIVAILGRSSRVRLRDLTARPMQLGAKAHPSRGCYARLKCAADCARIRVVLRTALALVLLASSASAADWTEYRFGPFRVVSNAGDKAARERLTEMEQTRFVLGNLLGKTDLDIARRYQEIGARRYRQRVPLSELVWAIVLTKENLWEFLSLECVPDRLIEVFGELELLQLLGRFFDRAIHYAVVGYEQASAGERPNGRNGRSRSRGSAS